jgi:hypothetical protein
MAAIAAKAADTTTTSTITITKIDGLPRARGHG